VKIENDFDQQNYSSLNNNFPYKDRPISLTTVNLMQPSIGHYIPQQQTSPLIHRQSSSTNNYGRINSISPTHTTYLNSYVKKNIFINFLFFIFFKVVNLILHHHHHQ
jgi:hypothetical protein